MKSKSFLLTLAFLMVFSMIIPGLNNVSASGSTDNENDSLILDGDKADLTNGLSEELIEKADNYINFTGEQYEINNVEELRTQISQKELTKVQDSVNKMNSDFNEFTEEDWDMANVNTDNNTVSFGSVDSDNNIMSGKNGITKYWWGYKLFLSDNVTRTTAQALLAGAGAATLVSIWSPWFTAPTATIKAVAATVAVVFGGTGGLLLQTNEGNGIYLRFTGKVPVIAYTGMFPQ